MEQKWGAVLFQFSITAKCTARGHTPDKCIEVADMTVPPDRYAIIFNPLFVNGGAKLQKNRHTYQINFWSK